MKHEKLIHLIINKHFQTLYFKKSNIGVYLADENRFPADKSLKRFCVRSLVVVIRLIGNSDNRLSTVKMPFCWITRKEAIVI
jgi:hypothetical protein